MARHINKVALRGNLGRDPKAFGDGGCELSIATTEKWKDRATGQPNEVTDWHKVVVFGNSAKYALEYMKKGYLVEVEGRLKYRKWTDQQEVDRVSPEIIINNGFGGLDIIYGERQTPVQQGDEGGAEPPGFVLPDDDIPF